MRRGFELSSVRRGVMEYYPQGAPGYPGLGGRVHLPPAVPAPADLRQSVDEAVFQLVQDLQKGYSGVCEKGDERENALLEPWRRSLGRFAGVFQDFYAPNQLNTAEHAAKHAVRSCPSVVSLFKIWRRSYGTPTDLWWRSSRRLPKGLPRSKQL